MAIGWKISALKNLPKTLQKQLGSKAPAITIVVASYGAVVAGHVTGADTRTSTSYAGNGFVDDYKVGQIDGTNVLHGDRKVVAFVASFLSTMPVPKADDQVIAEGDTYQVVRVERDPAGATYEIQVRR